MSTMFLHSVYMSNKISCKLSSSKYPQSWALLGQVFGPQWEDTFPPNLQVLLTVSLRYISLSPSWPSYSLLIPFSSCLSPNAYSTPYSPLPISHASFSVCPLIWEFYRVISLHGVQEKNDGKIQKWPSVLAAGKLCVARKPEVGANHPSLNEGSSQQNNAFCGKTWTRISLPTSNWLCPSICFYSPITSCRNN